MRADPQVLAQRAGARFPSTFNSGDADADAAFGIPVRRGILLLGGGGHL